MFSDICQDDQTSVLIDAVVYAHFGLDTLCHIEPEFVSTKRIEKIQYIRCDCYSVYVLFIGMIVLC